jgi:hypothetical protein
MYTAAVEVYITLNSTHIITGDKRRLSLLAERRWTCSPQTVAYSPLLRN